MIVGLLIFILKSEKYMKKLMMMVLALSIGFATTAQTRQDSTRKKTEKSKPVNKNKTDKRDSAKRDSSKRDNGKKTVPPM